MVCACLTAGFDAHEHLRIGGELAQEEEQALHGLRRAVAGEGAANDVDFLHHPSGEDELLTAGATAQDVDRGIDVHFRDAAVEHELHVAGAFELLEDELTKSFTHLRINRHASLQCVLLVLQNLIVYFNTYSHKKCPISCYTNRAFCLLGFTC